MTGYDWVAVVGAAAWLPQIAGFVVRWLAKPRLRFIPGGEPEVGYTTFGPILNIRCAISTSVKDAVIENIRLEVRHENGRVINFEWSTLNETFSQLRSPEGTTDVVRNQPAIALKVSTLALAEKLIGFQVPEFQEASRALIGAAAERRSHLEKTEADAGAALLKSKEFTDVVDYARRSMPWQVGAYTARVFMRMAGVKEPATEALSFNLTNVDLDRLNRNLDEIERYLRDMAVPPEGERKDYVWNWINPQLKRLMP